MLTSDITTRPRPAECTITCTVVPECDAVTERLPPAFTYHLKLGPQLLGIVNAYLTTALPLSLVQLRVAVPSSFDLLTEQLPDADDEANWAPMCVFVTWMVANAAAGARGDDKDEEQEPFHVGVRGMESVMPQTQRYPQRHLRSSPLRGIPVSPVT
jgi:hypothetical protein